MLKTSKTKWKKIRETPCNIIDLDEVRRLSRLSFYNMHIMNFKIRANLLQYVDPGDLAQRELLGAELFDLCCLLEGGIDAGCGAAEASDALVRGETGLQPRPQLRRLALHHRQQRALLHQQVLLGGRADLAQISAQKMGKYSLARIF